jgi:hypothetical protein
MANVSPELFFAFSKCVERLHGRKVRDGEKQIEVLRGLRIAEEAYESMEDAPKREKKTRR